MMLIFIFFNFKQGNAKKRQIELNASINVFPTNTKEKTRRQYK